MNLKRVLFVCLGNACRSQMAEGFARAQGQDVMEAQSAGLFPAQAVPEQTRQTMAEKKIDISKQIPKPVAGFAPSEFDIVVNISGYDIPGFQRTTDWDVRDPIGGSPEEYREVRDEIEELVKGLIFELRRGRRFRGMRSLRDPD